ncbi:MAG TPA: tetratricopeptide repeat protein [Pyrinomonadaceae bacterium]|nr:tetratricopeptide repeat protein [Pyrinomonadaceae bacterium]
MESESQPFVGPRPFEREDAGIFFGRGHEADDLLSLVIAHAIVLLYAPSGAGKTSLLNAKLIPLLEEEGLEVLNPARVQGQIPKDIEIDKIPNLYIFNILVSWNRARPEPLKLANMSLADFLKGQAHPLNREGMPSPRVVIFDQFEELFTAYPERWKERQAVFEQISDALEADHLLRVVFSIREDYIAELDPYASSLPDKLRTRFRLERLRERAALSAITEPLRGTERRFADGVAEQLVRNLMKFPIKAPAGVTEVVGEFVEPVQLQVVAQTLWQNLQTSQDKVITLDYLKAFGDVDQALSTFYERSIQHTVQATGVKEGVLRRWFERVLITAAGTRGTVFRGSAETGGIPNAAVDELENQHLVRAELRGGARWYELTHDRLLETIRVSNSKWLLGRSGAEQARQRLEARAAEWVRTGRSDTGLLDETELGEAERWLASSDATELSYSETLIALVEASRAAIEESANQRELAQAQALAREQSQRAEAERERAEEQRRRVLEQSTSAKRLRWLAALLALTALFAIGAAIFARTKLAEVNAAKNRDKVNRKAAVLLLSGDVEGALSTYNEALKLYQQVGDHEGEVGTLILIAKAYNSMDKKAEAEEYYKKAIEMGEKSLGPSSFYFASNLSEVAQFYRLQKKFEQAERLYTRSLEVRERAMGGRDNRLVANSLSSLGTTYREWGKDYDAKKLPDQAKRLYSMAEPRYVEALDILHKVLPKNHPDIAMSAYGLAQLYYLEGKDDKALPLFEEAVAIRRIVLPNHPFLATTLQEYAKLLRKLQRIDEAKKIEDEVKRVQENQS